MTTSSMTVTTIAVTTARAGATTGGTTRTTTMATTMASAEAMTVPTTQWTTERYPSSPEPGPLLSSLPESSVEPPSLEPRRSSSCSG